VAAIGLLVVSVRRALWMGDRVNLTKYIRISSALAIAAR